MGTNRPAEIEVRRPATLAPHGDGVVDAEAEGVLQPGALLPERARLGETGGRFEDHEPAASHPALDRIVPAGGPREDEHAGRVPARERPREARARLGERARRTGRPLPARRPGEGAPQRGRREGAEKEAARDVHGYNCPEMKRSIAAAVS